MFEMFGLVELSTKISVLQNVAAARGWIWALFSMLFVPAAVYAVARLVTPAQFRLAGRAVSMRLAGWFGKKTVDKIENSMIEPFVEGMREDNAVVNAWHDDTTTGPRG